MWWKESCEQLGLILKMPREELYRLSLPQHLASCLNVGRACYRNICFSWFSVGIIKIITLTAWSKLLANWSLSALFDTPSHHFASPVENFFRGLSLLCESLNSKLQNLSNCWLHSLSALMKLTEVDDLRLLPSGPLTVQPKTVLVVYRPLALLCLTSLGSKAFGASFPMSSPMSALISGIWIPFRSGNLWTSLCLGMLSSLTGKVGVENTRLSSTRFLSKSEDFQLVYLALDEAVVLSQGCEWEGSISPSTPSASVRLWVQMMFSTLHPRTWWQRCSAWSPCFDLYGDDW